MHQTPNDRLNDFRQEVYENCLSNSNSCHGCPIRGPRPGAHPEFGGLNPEADLVLVNNTPAAAEEESGPSRRRTKITSNIEGLPADIDGNYDVPDEVTHPYDYKLTNDWFGLGNGRKGPFEELGSKLFESEFGDESLNIQLEEIYYTNSLKCPGMIKENEDMDKEAREQCTDYLKHELLELVQPNVVLTGGREATASVFAALNIQLRDGPHSYEFEYDGKRYGSVRPFKDLISNPERYWPQDDDLVYPAIGQDPAVVPTYQFTGLGMGGNTTNFDWAETEAHYYSELIQRLNYELE